LVTRARCKLAFVALERDRVDLPVELRMAPDDSSLVVHVHDLSTHRDTLVVGAVPVGVVEDRLGVALGHRVPP
jgi:hypothetical protein